MDTKLKNRATNVGWLGLFTFGLTGALSLLSHGYFPVSLYLYTVCGIGALVLSLILLKHVPIFEWLDNPIFGFAYSRVPIDVRTAVAIIFSLYTLAQLSHIGPAFLTNGVEYTRGLVVCTVLVTLTLMQGQYILRVLHDTEEWNISWRRSVIYKVRTSVREAFLNRSTGFQMTLLLGVIFASGFGMMVVLMAPGAIVIYALLFAIVTIPTLVIIYKRIGYFNRIVENADGIVLGNPVPHLAINGQNSLTTLARSVNTLRYGAENSQAAQAKSERFKAELITNVSHDLRTPLTSIITYTQLLKTPELSNDNREAYIDIIDRKSKRLKVLIDDLFEASKIASGSIELIKEKVDVTQLLQQTLAENDEIISHSSLHFRVTNPEEPVYCVVDGQQLWRTFDNLIRNALKYSLENTRVYISVKPSQDSVDIVFKNIAKYELSENIDDLFERFKRGDTSRHTDGSGLGLAIAKSIVELHGGALDLDIDGDLFKATVRLKV